LTQIAVIGSTNVDLIVEAARRPEAGETILGSSFHLAPGGKGANQAVAIARLGGQVTFFGCTGDDEFGHLVRENLSKQGVQIDNLKIKVGESTGVAVVVIASGDNSIIVVSGANNFVSPAYIDTVRRHILQSDLVLMQNEIPLETIFMVTALCSVEQIPVILNPAPALRLEQSLIDKLDYIIPNEHEARTIFGIDNGLEPLLKRYPYKLIITLGEEGAVYSNGEQIVQIPAIDVQVVDTTGAGDTFIGAFSFAISQKCELYHAILFAQYAAGLSIEKLGAQAGMPTLDQVLKRMKDDGHDIRSILTDLES